MTYPFYPIMYTHTFTYHIACRCFARLLFISVFLTFRLVECTAGFTGDKFKSSKVTVTGKGPYPKNGTLSTCGLWMQLRSELSCQRPSRGGIV